MIYIYLKRNLTFLTFDLNDNFEKKNRINNLSSIYKLIDLYKNTQKKSLIAENLKLPNLSSVTFLPKLQKSYRSEKEKKNYFFPAALSLF